MRTKARSNVCKEVVMPTRTLPSRPDLSHLKNQARDLLRDHAAGNPAALQRIREFHPRVSGASDAEIAATKFALADALLTIAREYGFPSWPRLKSEVQRPDHQHLLLPHHERIQDPTFRLAVELLDAGDADGLHEHLTANPHLVRQSVAFEGGNYFQNPKLLEFVAENPIRRGSLPPNIVEVARIILEAGAKLDANSINETLSLVCSGSVARESGLQIPLIDLLCDYGANPDSALKAALGHGEFGAVEALLRRGAKRDLPTMAAHGSTPEVAALLPEATANERHEALAYASMFGHEKILRLLLDSGVDPNRFNPEGIHSHSTPMHQAALGGHLAAVKVLVEAGAKLDTRDILFGATPLDWAEHAGRADVADYLRELQI